MILLQDLDLYPIIFTNEAQESRLKSTKQPDLSSNLSSTYRIMHWIELASNFPEAIFFLIFILATRVYSAPCSLLDIKTRV